MKTLFTFCLVFAFCISLLTTVKAQVNKQDSLALVDLYYNTNGLSWYYHDCWLTGPVKKWYGVSLTSNRKKVQSLNLRQNNLTGTLSSSLGNLSSLSELNLSNNQLSGNIPPELGDLSNLKYLYLDYNQLNGDIPSSAWESYKSL